MFGSHDFETASRIAAEKSTEIGKRFEVVPAGDGEYTIGMPVSVSQVAVFVGTNSQNRFIATISAVMGYFMRGVK